MSIWCSWGDIGYDCCLTPLGDHGAVEVVVLGDPPEPRGEVRSYATGFSNHYPTRDGEYEQPANVGISSIPVWCVPGHDEQMDGVIGEWCRLSVYTAEHDFHGAKPTGKYIAADVVMDETAVRALVDDLTAWLEIPKAFPVGRTQRETAG